MLGAALGFVMPWKAVPIAITFCFLAGTGLATRALARQALSEGPATLAGCAALFSGYACSRPTSAPTFGELTGGFWIPFCCCSSSATATRKRSALRRAFDGSRRTLALVLAGAWLSNPPLGVMASYLLAAVALTSPCSGVLGSVVARRRRRCSRLGLSRVLPCPRRRRTALGPHSPGHRRSRHGREQLALRAATPIRSRTARPRIAGSVSAIAATMLGLAISASLVRWARPRFRGSARWWIPLALIPACAFCFCNSLSRSAVEHSTQAAFPAIPLALARGARSPHGHLFCRPLSGRQDVQLRIVAIASLRDVFLSITARYYVRLPQYCDEEDEVTGMLSVCRAGTGFQGTDEYAPPGADNSLMRHRPA